MGQPALACEPQCHFPAYFGVILSKNCIRLWAINVGLLTLLELQLLATHGTTQTEPEVQDGACIKPSSMLQNLHFAHYKTAFFAALLIHLVERWKENLAPGVATNLREASVTFLTSQWLDFTNSVSVSARNH